MTDEQIKQNAEAYADKAAPITEQKTGIPLAIHTAAEVAYLAGAHSRDEEITILRNQLKSAISAYDKISDESKRISIKNAQIENELSDYKSAFQVLETEIKRFRNPWISVEERLPEEGQTVIVRLAFGAGNHATCNYSNGQFVWALCIEASNINIQSRLKLPAITHWMPIPKV